MWQSCIVAQIVTTNSSENGEMRRRMGMLEKLTFRDVISMTYLHAKILGGVPQKLLSRYNCM